MNNAPVLVIGASGKVGSEIVRLLKQQGVQTKSATSKKIHAQADSDKVHVDVVTGEGLVQAFAAVDKAFLLLPPGQGEQYGILARLIQQAKLSKLSKVVLMTALGANASDTTPFRKAEIDLEKSGLTYNIIRPNWFYQNFNTFWLAGILEHKKILLPAGNAKVSFIDSRDISLVATKLLMSDDLKNEAFDITGSVSVDHDEVAAAISKATGTKISYEEITPEEFKRGLLSVGMPSDYADFLVMIFGFLKSGYNASLTPYVKLITGQEPKSLFDYVNDYKGAWQSV